MIRIDGLKTLFVPKYFLVGLGIAFLAHTSGSCLMPDRSPIKPGPISDGGDVARIDEGAQAVQTALLSGNATLIANTLTSTARERYGADLPRIETRRLTALGEAYGTRELKVHSDMYAEYSYTKDGAKYTFAMAKQEDGSWKLMRL